MVCRTSRSPSFHCFIAFFLQHRRPNVALSTEVRQSWTDILCNLLPSIFFVCCQFSVQLSLTTAARWHYLVCCKFKFICLAVKRLAILNLKYLSLTSPVNDFFFQTSCTRCHFVWNCRKFSPPQNDLQWQLKRMLFNSFYVVIIDILFKKCSPENERKQSNSASCVTLPKFQTGVY